MKILHVTAQKPDSTGSGVYLAQTVAALKRQGHEQAVICGVDTQDVPALPQGVALYDVHFNTEELPFNVCGMSDEMPYPSTRYRDMTPQMLAQFKTAFLARLNKALDEFQPQVIVCNHLYLLTALVRENAGGVPVVGICHNTCLRQLEQHDMGNAWIKERIAELDLVLALHEDQRKRVLEMFDLSEERVRIIGSGYNAQVFNMGDRVIDEHPEHIGRDLLDVGKMTYKKGISSLLSAVSQLKCPPKTVTLRLCGGVSNSFQQTALDLLIQENPQNIEYLGRVDDKTLAEQYRKTHIFTLASFYEGLPLCVIEALACGCKVVVTDLPGLRPWIEENIPNAPVWYVQPPRMQDVDEPLKRDLPEFEERFARVIEEAAAAKPNIVSVSHLSWDGLAKRLAGYCEELLS